MEQFYKLKDVAKLLSVSMNTLYRWAREGKFQIIHLDKRSPRISKTDLERFIGERKENE